MSQDFFCDIWLVGKVKTDHKQNESNDPFCLVPAVQIVACGDAIVNLNPIAHHWDVMQNSNTAVLNTNLFK